MDAAEQWLDVPQVSNSLTVTNSVVVNFYLRERSSYSSLSCFPLHPLPTSRSPSEHLSTFLTFPPLTPSPFHVS